MKGTYIHKNKGITLSIMKAAAESGLKVTFTKQRTFYKVEVS